MVILDSNSLLVLIVGLIDPNLFKNHSRTSIYEKEDLKLLIGDYSQLIVLPNIWTEVDNLLNKSFSKNYKDSYVKNIRHVVENSTEKYLQSSKAFKNYYFYKLGISDSLILEIALECEYLISSDSDLSDIARANGIKVYDLVEIRNLNLTPKP